MKKKADDKNSPVEGDETLREALVPPPHLKALDDLTHAVRWGHFNPRDVNTQKILGALKASGYEIAPILPQPRPQAPAIGFLPADIAQVLRDTMRKCGCEELSLGDDFYATLKLEGASSPKGSPGVGYCVHKVSFAEFCDECATGKGKKDGAGPGRPDPDAKTRLEAAAGLADLLEEAGSLISLGREQCIPDGSCLRCRLFQAARDLREPQTAKPSLSEAKGPISSPSPQPLVLVEAARYLKAATEPMVLEPGTVYHEFYHDPEGSIPGAYNANFYLWCIKRALSSLPVPSQASTGRECWGPIRDALETGLAYVDAFDGEDSESNLAASSFAKEDATKRIKAAIRMVEAAAPTQGADAFALGQALDHAKERAEAAEAMVETLEAKLIELRADKLDLEAQLRAAAPQARPLPLEAVETLLWDAHRDLGDWLQYAGAARRGEIKTPPVPSGMRTTNALRVRLFEAALELQNRRLGRPVASRWPAEGDPGYHEATAGDPKGEKQP